METSSIDFEKAKADYIANLPSSAPVVNDGLTARSAKVKQLLSGANGVEYKPLDGVAVYSSPEPLFIRNVRFYGPDVAAIAKSVEIKGVRFDGKEVRGGRLIAGKTGYAYGFFGQVMDSFNVIPLKKASATITKIEVVGYTVGQMEAVADQMRTALDQRVDLDKYLAQLTESVGAETVEKEALEEQVAALTAEVASLQEKKSSLEGDVGLSSKRLTDTRSLLEKLQNENRDANSSKEQLAAELSGLNEKIGETRFALKELIEKKRMISDEFSSFVVEGRGQARVYGWLALVPALTVAAAVYFLLKGAWNVAQIHVDTPQQAYALFLQRAPYTTATILAVTLLLKLLDAMVKKVMAIHEERLALAKLLVIAKDTVFAASSGLEVSDDEIFNQRLQVKMELLKAYLIGGRSAPDINNGLGTLVSDGGAVPKDPKVSKGDD